MVLEGRDLFAKQSPMTFQNRTRLKTTRSEVEAKSAQKRTLFSHSSCSTNSSTSSWTDPAYGGRSRILLRWVIATWTKNVGFVQFSVATPRRTSGTLPAIQE